MTTVQISGATKQKLETLKEREDVRTFDEVISRMANKELKIPGSMFGKARLSPWKKSDRMRLEK